MLSPGRTRSSPAWADFYHLSPAAARYLATMHPSGFDTRAVASDEAGRFLSVAQGTSTSPGDERIRDILVSNSFMQKISFIKDVFKGWLEYGRLGGRPSETDEQVLELFWEGLQERPQPGSSGGKFVWVTVGAPGGDGEYRSISLKEKQAEAENDPEIDVLRERLRALAPK